MEVVRNKRPPRGLVPRLRRALAALMEELGVGDKGVTVILTGDRRLRALKREWWGEDEATDVLSFPHYEPGDPFVPPTSGTSGSAWTPRGGRPRPGEPPWRRRSWSSPPTGFGTSSATTIRRRRIGRGSAASKRGSSPSKRGPPVLRLRVGGPRLRLAGPAELPGGGGLGPPRLGARPLAWGGPRAHPPRGRPGPLLGARQHGPPRPSPTWQAPSTTPWPSGPRTPPRRPSSWRASSPSASGSTSSSPRFGPGLG